MDMHFKFFFREHSNKKDDLTLSRLGELLRRRIIQTVFLFGHYTSIIVITTVLYPQIVRVHINILLSRLGDGWGC